MLSYPSLSLVLPLPLSVTTSLSAHTIFFLTICFGRLLQPADTWESIACGISGGRLVAAQPHDKHLLTKTNDLCNHNPLCGLETGGCECEPPLIHLKSQVLVVPRHPKAYCHLLCATLPMHSGLTPPNAATHLPTRSARAFPRPKNSNKGNSTQKRPPNLTTTLPTASGCALREAI